ncbi:hypothetical protein LCM17_17235 [Cereibacter sphaeroides]|nr:hypothetical protein [Cereibacter sphaeroides]
MFLSRSLLAAPFLALALPAAAQTTPDSITLTQNGVTEVLTLVPLAEDTRTAWMDNRENTGTDSFSGGFLATGESGAWWTVIDIYDGVATWATVTPPSGDTLFEENPTIIWTLNDDGMLSLSGVTQPVPDGATEPATVRLEFTVTLSPMPLE